MPYQLVHIEQPSPSGAPSPLSKVAVEALLDAQPGELRGIMLQPVWEQRPGRVVNGPPVVRLVGYVGLAVFWTPPTGPTSQERGTLTSTAGGYPGFADVRIGVALQ